MKKEQFIFDDVENRIIHKRTFDTNTSLEQAKRLRDSGAGDARIVSDSKLAARVPMWMVTEWLKEAGLKWGDPAAKDVMRRKLLAGEHKKLRVWEGTF